MVFIDSIIFITWRLLSCHFWLSLQLLHRLSLQTWLSNAQWFLCAAVQIDIGTELDVHVYAIQQENVLRINIGMLINVPAHA
jgi:EamA domain-containing membrane protein RarD